MYIAIRNEDYVHSQRSLNAGETLSITYLIDTIAFEPDETFVLDLSVNSITPAASAALLDASLINVFFRSRQNFIIQDSTGRCIAKMWALRKDYNVYSVSNCLLIRCMHEYYSHYNS